MWNIRLTTRILLIVLLHAPLAWAATATNLRPTADGELESWQDSTDYPCSLTTCYPEVDDASGANCTTTPGDGTYNHSTTSNGSSQEYGFSLSAIPDGSTLQSAIVYACAQRGGNQNVTGLLSVRFSGLPTSCGTEFTATSAWGDFNCTIDFADTTKTSGTVFQIRIKNTQNRDLRATAIKVDITYAPPAVAGKRAWQVTQP